MCAGSTPPAKYWHCTDAGFAYLDLLQNIQSLQLSSITIVRASKSRTGVQVSFMRGTKNVMRTSPVNNKIADKKPSFWGMVLLHDHFFLSSELHWYVLQATAPARTWRNFRPTSLKNTDEQNSHQKILLTVDSWFKQSSENILLFPSKSQNESR